MDIKKQIFAKFKKKKKKKKRFRSDCAQVTSCPEAHEFKCQRTNKVNNNNHNESHFSIW